MDASYPRFAPSAELVQKQCGQVLFRVLHATNDIEQRSYQDTFGSNEIKYSARYGAAISCIRALTPHIELDAAGRRCEFQIAPLIPDNSLSQFDRIGFYMRVYDLVTPIAFCADFREGIQERLRLLSHRVTREDLNNVAMNIVKYLYP